MRTLLLREQQTTVDQTMAFRLLIYTIRLMETHLRQNPGSTLPLVYPLVVYSGMKVWDAPLEIFPLFGKQEYLARDWFLKSYQLVDIQRTSDEELQKNKWSGLVEFALKYQDIRDFASFLETLLPWIHELTIQKPEQGLFLGKVVLQYVLNGANTNNLNLFFEKANHHLSGKLGEDIMTLAQELERRGMQKGIQQGMQQGEAIFLKRLLERRFKHIPLEYQQRIEQADPHQLLIWGEKFLEVQTLEEIFADDTVST